MQRIFRWTLAIAFLFITAFAATVHARGGRGGGHHGSEHHGGEHHGGQHHGEHHAEHHSNHHSSHHHSTHHSSHHADHHGWHHDAQGWVNGRHGVDRPFTRDWYAAHPGAWNYGYRRGNLWGWAELGAVTSWLGWPAYDIVENEPALNAPDNATINEAPAVAANYGAATPTSGEPSAPAEGKWLPLGVFALEPPQEGAEQLVQLALARDGAIGGVAVNKASGQSVNLIGSVNKDSKEATWTAEGNPKIEYSTPLETLTAGEGQITVEEGEGEPQVWTAARLKEPSAP